MSRRVQLICSSGISYQPSSIAPFYLLPIRIQHRTFITRLLRRRGQPNIINDPQPATQNPEREKEQNQPPERGRLAPNSLISEYLQNASRSPKAAPAPPTEDPSDTRSKKKMWERLSTTEQTFLQDQAHAMGWEGPSPARQLPPLSMIKDALENKATLKPIEEARLKAKIPELVRRRGRLGRKQLIKRSERELTSQSPHIKTSVKKLQLLARQIAGKKIEDAMVQMRFSKKKAAADVLKHLEYARNKAMVESDMGLGKPPLNIADAEAVAVGKELDEIRAERQEMQRKQPDVMGPVVVRDRKNQKRLIDDRSAIYIDQAWVGHAKYEYDTDYRARGRGYRLNKPYTMITVILKEERTRLREAMAKQAKRENKNVWVPLPDRPITAQRQYPLW